MYKVERLNVKLRRYNETSHYEPSRLDLCCLQKSIIITCGSERFNYSNTGDLTTVTHSSESSIKEEIF